MTPPDNDDHHAYTEPDSVGDERTLVIDVLEQALDAGDTDAKNYHLREALQLLHIENREEIVRLVHKALDAEDTDATEVFVREALELLRIENTVVSATRTNSDERAK